MEIYAALAKAQAKFPSIDPDAEGRVSGKDGKQGYSYQYATLAKIVAMVRPALNEQGLFISQPVKTEDDGTVAVQTIIYHSSGEHLASEVLRGRPTQPGMQAIGGVISYLKRYQLSAFLALSVGEIEEDDGAKDQEAVERSMERNSKAMLPQRRSDKPDGAEAGGGAPPINGDLLQESAKKTLRAAMERAAWTDEMLTEKFAVTVDTMPFSLFNTVMKAIRG